MSVTTRARSVASLAILLAFAWPVPAVPSEMDEPFVGAWEQIASNSGPCPTCRIVFEARGEGLTVVANNGWTATLPDGRDTEVSGTGRWDARVRGWPAGRAFTIRFRREGDRLLMTMMLDLGAEPARTVLGTYRRPWQGV